MEKRPKRKPAGKRKRTSKGKSKDDQKLDAVRHDVLEMVESHAHKMTAKVIEQAEEAGELATVKYLLEAANILHPTKDDSETSKEEDSLAETLLQRLNIPTAPVVRDEEEGSVVSDSEKVDDNGNRGEEHAESAVPE